MVGRESIPSAMEGGPSVAGKPSSRQPVTPSSHFESALIAKVVVSRQATLTGAEFGTCTKGCGRMVLAIAPSTQHADASVRCS